MANNDSKMYGKSQYRERDKNVAVVVLQIDDAHRENHDRSSNDRATLKSWSALSYSQALSTKSQEHFLILSTFVLSLT